MKKIIADAMAVMLMLCLTGCSRNSDNYSRYKKDKSSHKIETKGNVTVEEVNPSPILKEKSMNKR